MGIFKKAQTHEKKVDIAYRCYKAEMVDKIFPGGKQQVDRIIRSLAKVYHVDLAACDGKAYYNILNTYTDILIRKVITKSKDTAILNSLMVKHSDIVKTRAMAQKALTYSSINMENHNFTLNNQADVELLPEEDFGQADHADVSTSASSGKPETDESEHEGYYFENVMELAVYGKFHGKNKVVDWLQGDNYFDLYKKGYDLVEERRYSEAINVLTESLVWNPIGLSARFEIAECHIQMKNFASARETLYSMTNYLVEPARLARFYRRLGFIGVEEGQYQCAAACFVYSKKFEDHPSVKQELLYIRSKYEFDVGAMLANPIPALIQGGIPVLTKTKLDD